MSNVVTRLADWRDPNSFSNRMRGRRFELFERLAAPLPRPLRILDVGGTEYIWEFVGWAGREDVEITMLNLAEGESSHDNITTVVGDATNLEGIADDDYDVTFSNSVIEHLYSATAQAAMAREMRRVGRAMWLQTPNFWFPMEPHFHVVGWQWLPERTRVEILRRRTCGWRTRTPDPDAAREIVREVRLMRRAELARLFPGATIVPERFLGAVKSWIVHDGFPPVPA